MRFDQLPRSDNVEDRRGDRSGFPMGRAGGIGLGTIILLAVVGWALGINPIYLIGGAEVLSRLGGGSQQQSQPSSANPGANAPSDQMKEFVSAVAGSAEVQWKEIFARAGKSYQPPTLVMFSGGTSSACGLAQSAMGPFYCPNDQRIYLDTSFFQDLELSRPRAAFPGLRSWKQELPIFASLCDHARGRPSRAEFARDPAPGAADAAACGPGRGQPAAGPRRAAGRLLCRRMGTPRGRKMAAHRTG
jgi:Putative neutral zinc metallopeptidase